MGSSPFDVIVIGAGSAGCAVASRLSEDPNLTVLHLEAGGSDRRLSVRAPLAYSAQMRGPTDWNFTTEPEPGCENRRLEQPRGKVIGGTSSMNAMVWVRGSRRDYHDWSLPGWSWDDVEPVYRRIEDHYLGPENHGVGGPIHVILMAEPYVVAT